MSFEALKTFLFPHRLSVDEEIYRKLSVARPDDAVSMAAAFGAPVFGPAKPRLLTTDEILKAYGDPGDPDNLTTIVPPFPMVLAWDPAKPVSKITCHRKVATPLFNVLKDILYAYGETRVKQLGINLFGGCLNHRPQRGLEAKYSKALAAKNYQLAYTYLSRHSWAIAIDLDPARNALKTRAPKAQFSKPEYRQMVDSFYNNGFIGYGRERNNDYMHFEIGVIL